MTGTQCPACNGKRFKNTDNAQVKECKRCGAIFGTLYLGESYNLVKPFFSELPESPLDTRYFDFTTLGSAGIGRRHGWFDIRNKKIVQTG